MIKKEDLLHWEELSKLSLSEEERKTAMADLGALLRFCEPLLAIAPESVVEEAPSKTREDLPESRFSREEMLRNAPCCADGMIAVPKSL